MTKSIKTPLAIALGGTLLSGIATTSVQATEISSATEINPFSLTELTDGYMQTAKTDAAKSNKMEEGKCGEGKCGSAMMKGSEEKTAEGNCAGNKPMPKMKKSNKKMEGKCGEGKCGGAM